MNAALDRLLARATGREASRLRPRQPSLFEPEPAGPGASETWAESWTAPDGAEPQQPGPPPSQPEAETATEPLPVRDDAPARLVAPELPPAPATPASAQPTLARRTEGEAVSSRLVPEPPRNTPATARRAANAANEGEPPLRGAERVGTADPQAEPITPPPPRMEPRAPDAPSRRERPPRRPEPVLSHSILNPAGPAPAAPAAARRPRPAAAPVAEPEIRIHIGRLEVRATPAAPATGPVRPERPERSRPEKSLSDYLRKRGT